jgi:D-methionine transport system ATP-binding protein
MMRQLPLEFKQLRLENVGLRGSLGAGYLLQNLSFEVFEGDRLAIIGPSSAGKTSLLRLLNRLSEASQGQLWWNQQPLQHIPIRQLRQQVMLVPQESKLLGMTVQQALAYPLELQGMKPQIRQARLADWIERMRIPSDWLDRTEFQLSVGQRQWIAITRALVAQPQILLLDEPTSALDAGRANQLLEILLSLNQRDRLTILMVNHQLELAQAFCTRVLFLQQGHLLYNLPSDQVDWPQLKQTLVDAEAQAAEEWI